MRNKANAYEKMKNKRAKGQGFTMSNLASNEDAYFGAAGVAVVLMPFVSVIDGGFGLAVAYGARKAYKHFNG